MSGKCLVAVFPYQWGGRGKDSYFLLVQSLLVSALERPVVLRFWRGHRRETSGRFVASFEAVKPTAGG